MKNIIFIVSVFMLATVVDAHAYLDPNSGTGLIALFVAIFAGIAFYAKKIFYGIKSLFTKNRNEYGGGEVVIASRNRFSILRFPVPY